MQLTRLFLGLVAAASAATLIALPGAVDARSAEIRDPIRIGLINSSDFDTIAYVYGHLLEDAGYRVDYVTVDYAASFTAIQFGDIHVSFCWDTTWESCIEGIQDGTVINTGSSGVGIREGFWYPSYVAELCPGLPHWEALLEDDCVAALSTVETAPRGRFVAAPADWVTFVDEMIEAFELPYETVTSGSPAALIASLQGATQRGEPVLGWGYSPNAFIDRADGAFVEFPPYAPECRTDPSWGVNPDKLHDCDLAGGYVWKFMNREMSLRADYATRILYLLQLDTPMVAEIMELVDNQGMPISQATRDWVDNNPDVWEAWLR